MCERLLGEGTRVAALDPWYFGESALGQRDFLFGLLVASLGERPLGIEVGPGDGHGALAAGTARRARWRSSRAGRARA